MWAGQVSVRSCEFSGDRTSAAKRGRRYEISGSQRDLASDNVESPISDRSLLPLLPSVQILYCSFCSASVGVSRLVQRAAAMECRSRRRAWRAITLKAQYLIGLCYLCCLLFKLSTVDLEATAWVKGVC